MQSSAKNSEIHNSNQKLVLHMWEDSGQSFLKFKKRSFYSCFESDLHVDDHQRKRTPTNLFDGEFPNLVLWKIFSPFDF